MTRVREVLIPRDQQPQDAAGVAWENPLTEGLVSLLLRGRNVVTGLEYDSGTTLARTLTQNGEGVHFPGTVAGFSATVDNLDTSRGLSAHVIINAQDLTNTNTFAGFGGTVNDRYAVLDLSGTESNDPIRVIQNGGTFGGTYYESPLTDQWVAYTAVFNNGTDNQLYRDGVLLTPTYSAGSGAADFPQVDRLDVGQSSQGTPVNLLTGGAVYAAHWNRRLTAAEAASLNANPWQLFAPQRIFVPVSASVVTGTSAQTNANDAPTASGTTTVAGSVARTGAGDASSASGAATVSGASARTNANDTGGAVGTTTVVGTTARVGAADESAASGSAGAVTGTVAVNEHGDTGNASGSGGNARGAGTGSHKVAIQDRGRILLFETEEEAETWLLAQAPQQEKTLVRAARKVARKVVRQESALAPVPYLAPRVITGTQEVKALINMRAALLQTRFDEEIKRQIAREMAEQEDEEMAAAVMLMMY